MEKELFVETISALQAQYEHDAKCGEAFQVILPSDFVTSYDNHWANNQLVKLLQVAMNDEHKDSWIEYFIYELDFGKLYQEGCAEANGLPIDISDAGKLYDFLHSQTPQ